MQNENGNVYALHRPQPQRPPAINLPPVVLVLIGILIAIELLLNIGGQPWRAWTDYLFAFVPARFGPQPFPQAPGSALWSMVTYGFLHAGWAHVLMNSVWLAVFSKPVADFLGTARYLVLLAASVIAGALVTLAVHWGQAYIMVGISAGVSGLLAGAIPLMYAGRDAVTGALIPLRPLEILKNRGALTFSIMWLGLTLLTGSTQYLTGQAFVEQTNVAWEAHLGGFAGGLVVFYLLLATLPRKTVSTLH